ncbi:unnamed protein product [Soboliphyme baturini]|uniref:CUPID domain-containing protein n=1 Tax=Soboliphyme baturini TaxID=241478 RepID=A0A183IHR7_9BILA|nr:unnamed protein product [Soboliphyme baturini]
MHLSFVDCCQQRPELHCLAPRIDAVILRHFTLEQHEKQLRNEKEQLLRRCNELRSRVESLSAENLIPKSVLQAMKQEPAFFNAAVMNGESSSPVDALTPDAYSDDGASPESVCRRKRSVSQCSMSTVSATEFEDSLEDVSMCDGDCNSPTDRSVESSPRATVIRPETIRQSVAVTTGACGVTDCLHHLKAASSIVSVVDSAPVMVSSPTAKRQVAAVAGPVSSPPNTCQSTTTTAPVIDKNLLYPHHPHHHLQQQQHDQRSSSAYPPLTQKHCSSIDSMRSGSALNAFTGGHGDPAFGLHHGVFAHSVATPMPLATPAYLSGPF